MWETHKAAAIPNSQTWSNKNATFRSFWSLHCFWKMWKIAQGSGESEHQTWTKKEAKSGHPWICIAFWKRSREVAQGSGDSENQTWAKKEAKLGHSGIFLVFENVVKSRTEQLRQRKPNLSRNGCKFRSFWDLPCFWENFAKSHKAAAIPNTNPEPQRKQH